MSPSRSGSVQCSASSSSCARSTSAASTASNGLIGAARRFLRDIAEPGAARHLDRAVVGIELADEDFHQRRLAGAVAADQPDAAARRDRRRGAVEDRAAAEAHGDGVDGDHRGAPLAGQRRNPNHCLQARPLQSRHTTRKSAEVSASPAASVANCTAGRAAEAVGIEQQRAGGAVVDDPVVGLGRGGAGVERARRERARGEPGEHRVLEPDRVVGDAEVADRVDVAAAERGGEREACPPRRARPACRRRPCRRARWRRHCRRSMLASSLPVRLIAPVPALLLVVSISTWTPAPSV